MKLSYPRQKEECEKSIRAELERSKQDEGYFLDVKEYIFELHVAYGQLTRKYMRDYIEFISTRMGLNYNRAEEVVKHK